MGLMKPDFYRFFLIGFGLGALFVVSTIEGDLGERIARGVVPVAEAQAAN